MENFRQPELHKAALAELIGTFFLALAALISGSPFVVGLTLAAFVYAIGDISGCNINPAVTAALVTLGRISSVKGVYYLLAQIVGALLAREVAGLVNPHPFLYASGNMFAEFFGVAFLILTVAAVSSNYVTKSASGIAIGSALAAGLVTSQGVLNPAIALAMGLATTPGIWAALLGGVVFAIVSRLYLSRKGVQPTVPASFEGKTSRLHPAEA